MYQQDTESFTKRDKPFIIPALIVSALPINQARHILRSYGWDDRDFAVIAKHCQVGEHMTGDVKHLINILSAMSY
jgi:hypothetical protein